MLMSNLLVLEESAEYKQQTDYDGLWKKIISELLEEFILFMAPELYEEIDLSKGYKFLEQELNQQNMKTKKGRRYVDKLVKVYLKNGKEKFILIHIEIQGTKDSNLPKRMFEYFYKLYDYYQTDIYTIAVITDISESLSAEPFRYSFFGTKLTYHYNCYKFCKKQIPKLKESTNPIAMAILAGIFLHTTKMDTAKRHEVKRKLLESVLDSDRYPNEQYISSLFYFIDYLLYIPQHLASKLTEELFPKIKKEADHMIQSEKARPSPTLAEVFEKLRMEGALAERRNLAAKLIRENFSDEKVAKLTKLDINEVMRIRKNM